MLQVAIVEDELFMREFLENCINYTELGFNICGSYCCAEDALEGLKDIQPDLVITDIKMSGMDGITFMSEMLKINPTTHFIVISNYQDFEIVRSAFRIGICDYIPKIDFELDHYRETLSAFAASKGGQVVKPRAIQNKNLKERFWSDDPSSSKAVSDETDEPMVFAILEILNYEHIIQSVWKMDKELLQMGLSNLFEEKLSDFGNGEFFFNEYDKLVLLFSSKDISAIKELLTEICDFLKTYFQFEVCVFLDEEYTKLKNLKVKYTELYKLKKFRFFLPGKTIITEKTVDDFSDTFDCVTTYAEIEKLFANGSFDDIIKEIEKINRIKPSAEAVEEVLYFYQNIFMLISGANKKYRLDFLDASSIKEFLAYSNHKEVSAILIRGIQKIAEHVSFPEKKLGRQIDDYIQKHYAEKLSLEEMAKVFQYEYSYFSKMFRKIKGVTFKKYLNSFRLEKAENLIRHTSLKYSEIAIEVGYQNYEHFSRSFHEKYGCWPGEIERTDENA